MVKVGPRLGLGVKVRIGILKYVIDKNSKCLLILSIIIVSVKAVRKLYEFCLNLFLWDPRVVSRRL